MSKLVWDATGERLYETGVKMGVLYVQDKGAYPKGVAWNGLTSVTESPSGAEATPLYADDIKYLNLMSTEEFGASIEAYMYPDEFAECDGSAALTAGVYIGQQPRKTFGLAVKTLVGNDEDMNKHGYKIHIVYGALASVSDKNYSTVNDSPEVDPFSWEFTTTPVAIGIDGFEPSSYICINSLDFADAAGKPKLKDLEDALYGSTSGDAYLPTPAKVFELLGYAAQ